MAYRFIPTLIFFLILGAFTHRSVLAQSTMADTTPVGVEAPVAAAIHGETPPALDGDVLRIRKRISVGTNRDATGPPPKRWVNPNITIFRAETKELGAFLIRSPQLLQMGFDAGPVGRDDAEIIEFHRKKKGLALKKQLQSTPSIGRKSQRKT